MAGTASSEPYQRVSRDNGVFDGALIGLGVGAAASGATVGVTRMRYGGIEKRALRDQEVLKRQQGFYQNEINHTHNKFEEKKDKVRQTAPSTGSKNYQIDKINDKQRTKLEKLGSKLQKVNNDLAHESNIDDIKKRSMYGKHMGGWRNAAIIGASAVVGGGVGMIADGMNK